MHINCDMNNHPIYGYIVTNAISLSFCMVEHTQSSVSVELTQPCLVLFVGLLNSLINKSI